MKRTQILSILLFLCGIPLVLPAQCLPHDIGYFCPRVCTDTCDGFDTIYLPKWEPHLSVSTGFMGTGYGDNRLFTSVAPSLTYRPSDKWTIAGGFRITTDMGLNANYNIGNSQRSLAPYRTNGGTGIVSGCVKAQYQVNENFWLAGSVYHMGGSYAPFYGPMNGDVFRVSATAISAEAAFRFNNNDMLHVSFTYVRDHASTMPFMLHDAWMHSGGFGPFGMYATPADYCRMMAPYSPMFYGNWY